MQVDFKFKAANNEKYKIDSIQDNMVYTRK